MLIYQTLEDRENAFEIERDGPFRCRRNDAWLGEGYYFWDSHKTLGHWWGKITYGKNKYVICESTCILDQDCWDLHGEGKHRKEFKEAAIELSKSHTKNDPTVPEIIEFLKRKRFFTYQAIRIFGINSMNRKDEYSNRVIFHHKLPGYFDLNPTIQICLFRRDVCSFNGYKIVYPERMVEEEEIVF